MTIKETQKQEVVINVNSGNVYTSEVMVNRIQMLLESLKFKNVKVNTVDNATTTNKVTAEMKALDVRLVNDDAHSKEIPHLSLVPISFNAHQVTKKECVPVTIHFENKQITNMVGIKNRKHLTDEELVKGIELLMNEGIGEISFTDVSNLSIRESSLLETIEFHFVITHDTSVWSKTNFKFMLFEMIRKISLVDQYCFLIKETTENIQEGTPYLVDSIHITAGAKPIISGETTYTVNVSVINNQSLNSNTYSTGASGGKLKTDDEMIKSAADWYDIISNKQVDPDVMSGGFSSTGFISNNRGNNVKAMREALKKHKASMVSSNLGFSPGFLTLPYFNNTMGFTPNSIPGQPWDARHPAGAMPLRGEVMQEPNNTFGRLTRPQGTYISDQEIRIAKELYSAISNPYPNHKGLAIIEKALTYYAENRETITHVVVVLDLPHSLLLKHIKSFNQCILHVYTLETATEELLRDITGINIKPNHVFVDNSVIKMFRDHATRLLDSQL